MARWVLSHTADTGIEAEAPSLADLVHELAQGMFELVAPLDPSRAEHWVEVTVESPTVEDLVVDVLSELIYLSEADDLLFCAFRVEAGADPPKVEMEAGGVPMSGLEAAGPGLKAVTYHGLVVEEREGEWHGRVYFDV